jgi:hypothetical protein
MCEESLPANLRQVELEIGSLMRFQPQAEFGRRVVGAVRGEMRRERSAANWRFAIGLAAGAFLWLHLSFYVAPATDFHFRGSPLAMSPPFTSPGAYTCGNGADMPFLSSDRPPSGGNVSRY